MALLGRGPGDVAQGLLSLEADSEDLTRRQTVQGESSADECHGAEQRRDVDEKIGRKRSLTGGFVIQGFTLRSGVGE